MCDNPECKCTYCKNDNYDRMIGDHMRECLDEINLFISPAIDKNDPELYRYGGFDEEGYYNAIAITAKEHLIKLHQITNKININEGIPITGTNNDGIKSKNNIL